MSFSVAYQNLPLDDEFRTQLDDLGRVSWIDIQKMQCISNVRTT